VSDDVVQRRGDRPKPGDPNYVDRRSEGGKRGYRWPQFTAGNEMSLRHGAYSANRVRPVAEEIRAALPRVAPWTDREAFAGACASLAWVEAQLELLRAFVDEHGILDSDGGPAGAVVYMAKLEARAQSLRAELGLTPQALAKLLSSLVSVAVACGDDDGLDALKAEGVAILDARRQALSEGRS
jgi:hypothetical protein